MSRDRVSPGVLTPAGAAPIFLAGNRVATPDLLEVRSPWDGALAGRACLAGSAEVEAALAAARESFSRTRGLSSHERSRLCREVSRRVREASERLAGLVTAETGKPICLSRAEAERAALTFSLAADAALDPLGEVLPADIAPSAEGYLAFAVRVPRGPVAAITPFNFPLNLVAHKLAPAFAVGAPVVLKPAPQAPLSALALAELAAEAGAPPGLLSVLPCPLEQAERIAADPRTRVLSFTGSARAGWRLRALAGEKHCVLELGGNAAAVVCADADLAWAAERLAFGAYSAAGQVCISVQRVLVEEAAYDRFRDLFLAAARALPAGDPRDPATVMGPVIDSAAADRVEEWVAEAERAGASVHRFGERTGCLLPKFVLERVPPSLRVCREEAFGPVAVLDRFADFPSALGSVNESPWGLQAGVFTRDLERAFSAARELAVGGVVVNDFPTFRSDNLPYGGTKRSGLGREGVRAAMAEYCETRTVVVRGAGKAEGKGP